ncbi:MAG TPA: hypothetical protein VLY63_13265, partial [Anaerolineae bacterium]|nr:hypothetical protein [Anaerolineae bacterium]
SSLLIGTSAPSPLPPDQALRQLASLFEKLDEGLIEDDYARFESVEGKRDFGGSWDPDPGSSCCFSWVATDSNDQVLPLDQATDRVP